MAPRKPQRGYTHFKCCVWFAVKYEPRHRPQKMPPCPICEDNVDVKKIVHEQKSWTAEEDRELLRLHEKTAMTYAEIGRRLGRTKKSVAHRLQRIRAKVNS